MAPVATRIPDFVAHLDLATVADVLMKHGANVRAAALELGIPIPDLRQLTLVNQALIRAAYEAEEQRLDRAEAVVDEALASEDSRRRDAAAYFVLRNSARAKRRGWITSASAGFEVNVQANESLVFQWRTTPLEVSDPDELARRRAIDDAREALAVAEGKRVVTIGWGDSPDKAVSGGKHDFWRGLRGSGRRGASAGRAIDPLRARLMRPGQADPLRTERRSSAVILPRDICGLIYKALARSGPRVGVRPRLSDKALRGLGPSAQA